MANTPTEARRDLVKKMIGKTLVFDSFTPDFRHYFVPRNLTA